MMQFPLHDLHIHTNLSECSRDPLQTVENIVRYAAEHHIPTVGISNHVWDREIPGASDWYAPQDFDHILAIRRQIPSDLHGVRLLIGAETEFAGGKIALTRAHRDELDYVLVPHSHIHMVGLVLPRDRVSDRQVADYLVESFLDLVSRNFATAIAHPFSPVGRTPENVKAITDCISDDAFAHCFSAAREHRAAAQDERAGQDAQQQRCEYVFRNQRQQNRQNWGNDRPETIFHLVFLLICECFCRGDH